MCDLNLELRRAELLRPKLQAFQTANTHDKNGRLGVYCNLLGTSELLGNLLWHKQELERLTKSLKVANDRTETFLAREAFVKKYGRYPRKGESV